jgi:hypothetical protein
VRISSVAKNRGAKIIFTGLDKRTTDELVLIASAGKESVIFE